MNIQGRSAVGGGVTSNNRGVLSGAMPTALDQGHALVAKSAEGLLNLASQGQKYDIIPLLDEVRYVSTLNSNPTLNPNPNPNPDQIDRFQQMA